MMQILFPHSFFSFGMSAPKNEKAIICMTGCSYQTTMDGTIIISFCVCVCVFVSYVMQKGKKIFFCVCGVCASFFRGVLPDYYTRLPVRCDGQGFFFFQASFIFHVLIRHKFEIVEC